MRYEDEVPKSEQISLSQFRLLPGSYIQKRLEGHLCEGIVSEVGSANPEYVLGGPDAEDAGVIKWTEQERDECAAFIDGGHLPVKIRLRKSMWAVIALFVPGFDNPLKEVLYTYDVEELVKKGDLIITRR